MKFSIGENDAGQRLDRFLRKAFKQVPLSLIHKSVRKGMVKVDGRKRKGEFFLEAGQVVDIHGLLLPAAPKPADSAPGAPGPDVIWEDAHLVILNKQASLPVHGGTGQSGPTLIAILHGYLGQNAGLSFSPAFAHRLDRETSGLIVAAKTAAALRGLTALFRSGEVKKIYRAVISGHIIPPAGTIARPLEDKEGVARRAETRYRTIRTAGNQSEVEVELLTGRTHQIRRHFSGEGHPVAGDRRYGGPSAARLMLHSQRISFIHPVTGEPVDAEAPVPAQWTASVSLSE